MPAMMEPVRLALIMMTSPDGGTTLTTDTDEEHDGGQNSEDTPRARKAHGQS